MYKEALLASNRTLARLKTDALITDYALIGAMALSIYAEPRATADIDYAISFSNSNSNEIERTLCAKISRGDIYDPLKSSISFHTAVGKANALIQCVQFHPIAEQIAFKNVQELSWENTTLRVVDRLSLILLKLYAGSALDIEDAAKIALANPLSEKEMAYIVKQTNALRISSKLKALKRILAI